ncbi:MAG TPA: hypothetical protein VFR81_08060 [Longimicrobium sp.]|nr:hypothetical protein [Longimicrobium sp.]
MSALVAADADRVQDLIFRSSRLREVTGGSFALEQFWSGARELAKNRGGQALVSAGGTFRARFEDAAAAESFARDLQDLYALRIGGLLTTAIATGGGSDGELLNHAAARIGVEKMRGDPPAASSHFPYLQPCASCARDLASEQVRGPGPGESADLCRFCAERQGYRDAFRERFLENLRCASGSPDRERRQRLQSLSEVPKDANEVGRYDRRARVAYLLADGNGFGGFFRDAARSGDIELYTNLSETVFLAGSEAIAAATVRLVGRLSRMWGDAVPVLPLITGGDDIFALLPAPHALEFARDFVQAFVARMREARFIGHRGVVPSVSCALVFCKATFPYRFAHDAGEDALREAKRVSRDHAGVSLLRAVELRGTVGAGPPGPADEYGVFAVGGRDGTPSPLLDVETLMDVRAALAGMRGKRRHQIEALYAAEDRGSVAWEKRRERVFERMEDGARVQDELGRLETGPKDGGRSAAVDLLHLWDYLEGAATPALEAAP